MEAGVDEYVALFCPHCGEHLNEVELQDDEVVPLVPWQTDDEDGLTCGWCGIRTKDWNHVIQCRRTLGAISELKFRQVAENLVSLERQLALGTDARTAF